MALTTVAVVLVFLVPLLLLLRTVRHDAAVQDLVIAATTFDSAVTPDAPPGEIRSAIGRFEDGHPGVSIAVFWPDGTAVGTDEAADRRVAEAFGGERVVTTVGHRIIVDLPGDPADDGGAAPRVVRASAADDATAPAPRRILVVLALSTGFAILVGGATGLLAARSIATPTVRLTRTARRLGGGDLTARATPEGPPELRDLATTFNRLADEVDRLLARERESGADLAHRLRTPVTALHLEVEALPDSPATHRLAERVDRLERTLTDVILDLRHASGQPVAGTAASCDLCTVVADRIADWSDVARDGDRSLTVAIGPDGARRVAVDAEDLEAVVDALVSNALHHTPPGTPVQVAVADTAGAAVELVVDDAGPGFPTGTPPRRGVSPGESTGLGLDIARRTVERTGGALHLERAPIGGARARATLPVVDG
ncbi:HAMP domain-containing histidine kinase [Nocardioides sp. GY 10113]|uniref:sensor histidine kinase n=1 Tax=Nocardioides sp. GY 10113 TaxID=2569761 RepID=UPI0010A7B5C5|nr:HAMP domain-containing sensor histidine kinase [Nocardioides sp. GY 10113]TIC88082.1 HAMP domain-containing histidine kinase [Nocardioides sp. GY 10113]